MQPMVNHHIFLLCLCTHYEGTEDEGLFEASVPCNESKPLPLEEGSDVFFTANTPWILQVHVRYLPFMKPAADCRLDSCWETNMCIRFDTAALLL